MYFYTMLTKEQEDNFKANAKAMVDAKNQINKNLNQLIKDAQKIGYRVNPKTGEVTKSIIT